MYFLVLNSFGFENPCVIIAIGVGQVNYKAQFRTLLHQHLRCEAFAIVKILTQGMFQRHFEGDEPGPRNGLSHWAV